MGKNSRYNNYNRQQRPAQTTASQAPADTSESQQENESVSTTETSESTTTPPQIIDDTLTQRNNIPPVQEEQTPPETDTESASETTPPQDQVEETEATQDEVVVEETADVDPLVAGLNKKLVAFKESLVRFGSEPEHFKTTAKDGSLVTDYVLNNPKVPVLDALRAFVVENKDGVCKPEELFKGSTTLPAHKEQQFLYLFNLFIDLAHRRVLRINTLQVGKILKTEIVHYYNRRVSGIAANR